MDASVPRRTWLPLKDASLPPRGLAPLCKGSWQGRQALTEGLWAACRNGITVTDNLLLHRAYNPSASHSLSTSPYTGEARSGRTQPARAALPGGKGWENAAHSHHFAGRQGVVGRSSLRAALPGGKRWWQSAEAL